MERKIKKCDHLNKDYWGKYSYCFKDAKFGIYAFVESGCHRECYINKQEERKLKLINLNFLFSE